MIDAGGYIKRHDLSAYQARIFDVPPTPYRDHHVYAAPGLTAGPTLCDALSKLETRLVSTGHPDTQTYLAYAVLDKLMRHALRRWVMPTSSEPPLAPHT